MLRLVIPLLFCVTSLCFSQADELLDRVLKSAESSSELEPDFSVKNDCYNTGRKLVYRGKDLIFQTNEYEKIWLGRVETELNIRNIVVADGHGIFISQLPSAKEGGKYKEYLLTRGTVITSILKYGPDWYVVTTKESSFSKEGVSETREKKFDVQLDF